MSQPAFSLAALDMAGTTVQDHGLVYSTLRSVVEAEVEQAISDEVFAPWTGTGKYQAIVGLITAVTGTAPQEVVDRAYTAFGEQLSAAYLATPPVEIPGATQALVALREAGVTVVLQTGYSRDIAESILAAVGWTVGGTVIDALVASDEVPASRPAPYLIHRAMELSGVWDVKQVLVAGDTPNDLGAGINAGAGYVVGVLSGAHSADALGRLRHTHLLPSVADLPVLL